jgi:hypothetical protein
MLETVSKSEVLNDEFRAKVERLNLAQDIKTERGLLNMAYRLRAHAVLYRVPGCSWLCDAEKLRAGEKAAWQPTILIELGKIRDTEAMIEIALHICDIKPKSKQGALMVKQARLGKPPGDRVYLANELIDTINNYSNRYEMSPDDILDALQTAYSQTLELKEKTDES